MKKLLLFVFVVNLIIAVISCSKKENPPTPIDTRQVAWVVGGPDTAGQGVILFTENGGTTWVRQGDPSLLSHVSLTNVWSINKQNVWIIGTGKTILHTVNGGTTWPQVPAPSVPATADLYSISIVDQVNIWISGDRGTVYSSPDDGITWTVYDTAFFHNGLMQGIYAITPHTIYVAGQYVSTKGARGFLGVTNDGGATWDAIELPYNYNRNLWIGVNATGLYNVIVYGETGHYATSQDGGVTWECDSIYPSGDINDLIMLTPNLYWAACDYDEIYRTPDGGATWIRQTAPPPGNIFLTGIDAFDTQTALCLGGSASSNLGKIVKTMNGGSTWTLNDTTNFLVSKVSTGKN